MSVPLEQAIGLELESKRAVVTLTRGLNIDDKPEWRILGRCLRTGRMYRAELPACECDRVGCVKHRTVGGWSASHGRYYCHYLAGAKSAYGAHLEHAYAFAARVLASYSSTKHKVNLNSDRIEVPTFIAESYIPRDYSAHRPEHLDQWPDYRTLPARLVKP
jgi:hypothetical protein